MRLLAAPARAYVYGGDWVADCPRGCGNVEHLYHPATNRPGAPRTVQMATFACSYCRATADIQWPEHMNEIMAVLMLRPIPHTRNWYPEGHETALKYGVPHGQSVQDLRDENVEHGVEPGPVLSGVG